jgi:hypothetical protein
MLFILLVNRVVSPWPCLKAKNKVLDLATLGLGIGIGLETLGLGLEVFSY